MKRIPVKSPVAFLEIMNKKELKQINGYLKKQYDVSLDDNFAYMMNTKDNLYMCTRDVERLPLKEMRVSSIGLYIGEFIHGEFRLSIEGSQLFGSRAKRNIVELNKEEMEEWMKGESIPTKEINNGYVIVRYNQDYLGSGRIKNGVLLNFIPKVRRVQELA